jgi:MFS family permease
MKIKRRYAFVIIAISLFIVDFGLTWYFLNFTPYAEEGNPLFGIDGGYLSLVLNLIYFVVAFFVGYFIERYETIIVEAKNGFDYFKKIFKMNRTDFIFISFLTAFIYASFASRLSVIIDWIIYGFFQRSFYSTQYAIIRDEMPFGSYGLLVALLSFLFFSVFWYTFEFWKSKKALSKR